MPVSRLIVPLVFCTSVFGQISELFRDPEKSCGLLEPQGFSPGELVFRPYGFVCSAVRDGAQSQKAITYTVSGENIYRVTRIKLEVQLAPGGGSKEALEEFTHLSEAVLMRLGIEVPKELPSVIQSTRYRRWVQKTGTVSYDPGRAPHTSRVLAVRHPGVRVVPIPRAN